jgi:sugar phosphate isomerase/epimerase
MKLSIWSSYYVELSPEEAVERFFKNGIFCSELSDEHGFMLLERDSDFMSTAKKFKEFIQARNFEIPQGHLWLEIKICADNTALPKLLNWIDMYEAIGIKNMVLHCDNLYQTDFSREEKIKRNVEKLRIVAEHIKDKDVKICLENLRPHNNEESKQIIDKSVDDLLHILGLVGSDNFAICLDTGHLNLTLKNQREFILKAGKHLKALHIADNRGVLDDHLMPFNGGNVDFKEVVAALGEINYSGIFNLEIPGERGVPIEMRDAKIAYVKACYDYLMR